MRGDLLLNITPNDLNAMKQNSTLNIKKEALVDIRNIQINEKLPVNEKILQYINQIKNPYLFLYGDSVVRVNFSETDVSFEERMKRYFEML